MLIEVPTELRKFPCTWLPECLRQVEAEVVSYSRNRLHQTTYSGFERGMGNAA